MQSSNATKSRLSSQKWLVISLLLSGVSLAISSTLRIRDEKRCEEIRAKYAVRQVAINALTHDIKATEKEMDRITKSRRWTAADKKRFDAIIKEHQARLAELQQS